MRKIGILFAGILLLWAQAYSQEDKVMPDSTRQMPALEEQRISEDDDQEDDDAGTSNFIPGLLHSSRDVYSAITGYTFSIAYFRERGLDNSFEDVCVNNFLMNSLVTGRPTYSEWGGLNHVMRYPETVTGNNATSFTFGGMGGATNYSTRASSYRKQIRATYSISNRTYTHRLMFTGSTGLLKSGWAFTGSLSTRFGSSLAYVDGSLYNGVSYFLSGEKKINEQHSLNLTVLGAPVQRSVQGNSVQEAYDLTGTNYYNPNWGWYNNKMRNARVRTVHEPLIMLTHYFTPDNNKVVLTSTLATTFGRNSTTALNWNDVPDPRPDYYRYLPSYQKENPALAAYIADQWQNNVNVRQIDWDHMYEVNQTAAASGNRAQYMVENRIYDHFQFGGASNLVANISQNIKLSAGIDARGMKQRNYKTINDLLGGAYWIDNDKYSEGDYPENDDVTFNNIKEGAVNYKDSHLSKGDVFGYDYTYNIFKEMAWAMSEFTYKLFEFHAGLELKGTQYWRTGHMQNGRFPDDSYGDSKTKVFIDYAFKAGWTQKITGRNYLVLNGTYGTEAPSILNAFIAPRIRNTYVDNLQSTQIASADFSYIMNYPFMKARLTAFIAQINNQTKLVSFYHDDYASMVNYSMKNIDQRNWGIELGTEIKMGSMFSLVLAGNWGDYRYTSRPEVSMNAENGYDILGDNNIAENRVVYWKNYHVAGTPQVAATAGIKFNHDYWWVNINANYFDKIYCDLNPERRTESARGTLDEEAYQLIAAQTKLKGQFTLDASISKSWRIKNKYNIGFNVSVTNILNNKNLITTAWEQYRFDYREYNVDKFQNKYYYAYGTTFYAAINFQM
ncbi:MAG: TonB-dependent receptor [Bacteroidales bacterium]|jgi:hypothetical protein|nr:TonB-dependent receptor [Bacteroidales bacterium]